MHWKHWIASSLKLLAMTKKSVFTQSDGEVLERDARLLSRKRPGREGFVFNEDVDSQPDTRLPDNRFLIKDSISFFKEG